MSKHTPGPWKINGSAVYPNIPYASEVCYVYGHPHNGDANARLISAAPEMLEALQYIVSWNETSWNSEIARDKARKAIAKAIKEGN